MSEEEKKPLPEQIANFFMMVYKIVQAADYPIYLIVVVFLPFIVPIPPAVIIRDSLVSHMSFDASLANVTAVSLVMLGYASVIAAVGAYAKARKDPGNEALKKEQSLKLFSWGVYLAALTLVAIALEITAGASFVRVAVLAVLTLGTEISAGVLNASRIQERDEKDETERLRKEEVRQQDKIRREKAETSLKRTALKHNINVFAQDAPQVAAQDAQTSVRSEGMIAHFQNDLRILGDWRVDESKLGKKELEWLQDAPTSEIMRACGVKSRSAQLWRERAKKKLH
jgi:hypothetical protein